MSHDQTPAKPLSDERFAEIKAAAALLTYAPTKRAADELIVEIERLRGLSRWQPITTAPKDGTVVDLLVDGMRVPDCRWGKPDHACGEAGSYCDSDWHREPEDWVMTTFNDTIWAEPTHWMYPPEPPHDA